MQVCAFARRCGSTVHRDPAFYRECDRARSDHRPDAALRDA
jgi:hypothetical protein